MRQYIAGAEAPENVHMAENAYNEFQEVLRLDPKDENATPYIAKLYFDQKKMDQAAERNNKLIAINPKNKDAYYTLRVTPSSQWPTPDRHARNHMPLTPEHPRPPH